MSFTGRVGKNSHFLVLTGATAKRGQIAADAAALRPWGKFPRESGSEIIARRSAPPYKFARMTPSQMFKEMSPALAQRVLDELATADKDTYRVAVAAVAQAKKVRPVFLE